MNMMAKQTRDAMKSKARRLSGTGSGRVDSTSTKVPEAFTGDKKTGLQPTTPRLYKRGGAVKRQEGGTVTNPTEVKTSMGRLRETKSAKDASRILPPPKEAVSRSGKEPQDTPSRKEGGRKWIAGAIKKPGALRKSLGVKEGKTIPPKTLDKAAKAPGKMGQRARLAQTLKRLGKKDGGKVGLTVVIADKKGQPAQGAPQMVAPRAQPVPMPMMQQPPIQPAPMPMVEPRGVPAPTGRPMGLKTGGRVSKVAMSYKDMTAGAGTGEGRFQKTDVAKLRKGAPRG